MQEKLNIRTHTWLMNNLSWAYVSERLINALDRLGHNTYVISTNGLNESAFDEKDKMVKSILALQNFGPGKKQIDIDWCYTVPQNFPQRFLSNSKKKCAIYNYETTVWPDFWKKYYNLADCYFPSSNFSAEIFYKNGIPKEKIFVIPHGVDTNVFNPSIPPIKFNTTKRFKFVSVVAPHARKNIPLMLDAYCKAFKRFDDVCFILKTKVYTKKDPVRNKNNPGGRQEFEITMDNVLDSLDKKYGKDKPEIIVLSDHVDNVSSIYNACNPGCHISSTGAEGFGLIFLESMACGLVNIAPRYSAQVDFMNDQNSILVKTRLRYAKRSEQYWSYNKKGIIGQVDEGALVDSMINVYKNYYKIKQDFEPKMKATVSKYTWEYAAGLMVEATQGRMPHYEPGAFNFEDYSWLKS